MGLLNNLWKGADFWDKEENARQRAETVRRSSNSTPAQTLRNQGMSPEAQEKIRNAKYGVLANNPARQRSFIGSLSQPAMKPFNPIKAIPSAVIESPKGLGEAIANNRDTLTNIASSNASIDNSRATLEQMSKQNDIVGQRARNALSKGDFKRTGNPYVNVGDFKGSGLVEDFLASPFKQLQGGSQIAQGNYKRGVGNVVSGTIEGPAGFIPVGKATTAGLKGSQAVKASALIGAREGAVYGGAYGASSAMADNRSLPEIATQGAVGTILGGAGGAAVPLGIAGARTTTKAGINGVKTAVDPLTRTRLVQNTNQAVRTAVSKPQTPENLTQKRIDLMTQRSRAEIQRPGNVPYFDKQLDLVDQQIKQATTRPIARPFVNETGAVGKDVTQYNKSFNVNDKDDAEYLARIVGEDKVKQFQSGDFSHFRGGDKGYYESIVKGNLTSETPKTTAQKLEGRVKPYGLGSSKVYHVTSADNTQSILNNGFKKGSELPESAYRGGGYGQMQDSISFATKAEGVDRFATKGRGVLLESELKPNSKVVEVKGVEYAEDLNDFVPELRKQGVDAVHIGGGENEVVVINPKSIKGINRHKEFDPRKAKDDLSEFYNQPTKNKLGLKKLNETGAVGKDVNKRAPKSPFEKDLQSAGLTGNKAVRPKENTVQTPKNQSQSTPKTEQPVAPQLAETANQTKAPQTKGRATSSELGQGERITSETPKRTASQSPEVKSNIVNPSIRERGFVETIIDDPKTSPKVKENLSSLYSVRNTKQLQTKAANLVKTDPDLAMRVAREDTSDIGVATGSELIKKLQQDGNYEQAIDLATNVAETLTKAGQTSQAASIYGKLTPEGILRFTQKEINAYNKATKKNIKLSPEQAKSLTEKAQKIQEMPEGRPRDIATQQMLKELYETMPSTWVEKVSTFQTMAQLLNPKTLIRNLGGNTIFSVLDNSSQVLATGIDKAISGVKGTPRTTTLPSIKTQAKGLKKGFNEGYEEAVKGINLGPRTQFELNDVPVFRDGLLGKAETGLNLSLRATDRAAYTAAFDDTLKGLMKTNKAKTATTEMIEIAHHQGLYRTFQDESNAAKIFVGLKKALNIAGFEQNGKRWGLGDLILKYPKTPGNLIARGIDYSPVGILKGMINLTQLNQGPIKQQAAANSIARGVTGTGSLIGTGYVLAGLGLITEKPEDNKDLRNLQKSAGLGGYQLNTSGLRRFLLSGFDTEEAKLKPGDKLVSYDWAQPAAIPLSMGASMGRGEGVKKGASQGLNALSEGVETLAEQPLVRGVQQFFGSNKSAADSVVDTVKSAPASFVPTLSNQVRQLTDNTTRNTSDPSALKEAYNKAINRVPGIAGQLPAQVDTLGNDKKNFQNGSNNPFNVFLNPSFVNKYQPNNVATTNLDLNRATGETKQLPNTVSNKVKINGQDKVLTGKEQGDYQKFVGQTNSTITDTLTKNPRFNALPDSQKVNLLASMQTDINNAAKVNLFGDNPEKLSESVDSILSGNVERAIELKLKTQEKTVEKKSGKKVAKAKSTKKKSSGKKGGRKGSRSKLADKSLTKLFPDGFGTESNKKLRDILKQARLS